MNEWIYRTDNFSNQAVVDFKIQSSHTEKAPKNDRQKWTSMYRVIFVTLLTNCKHMEKQSLICTRKTSFYTDNITIVVVSINWSRMFACMYIRCVANSNWKLWTTKNRQHLFGITGKIACVPIHAFALHRDTRFFFQWSFAWNLKNISPIVWYCCNIRRPYKLTFCTKQTRKQSLFYRQHPERHMTCPECLHFFGRMACLCSETPKGVL